MPSCFIVGFRSSAECALYARLERGKMPLSRYYCQRASNSKRTSPDDESLTPLDDKVCRYTTTRNASHTAGSS